MAPSSLVSFFSLPYVTKDSEKNAGVNPSLLWNLIRKTLKLSQNPIDNKMEAEQTWQGGELLLRRFSIYFKSIILWEPFLIPRASGKPVFKNRLP